MRMARILIVGDDTQLRDGLAAMLGDKGHDPLKASDASEALALLAQLRVDLVITDIEMPYVDGLELAFAMRSGEAARQLPLIFLTARNDDATWKQARFLDGLHVAKPASAAAIHAAVEK